VLGGAVVATAVACGALAACGGDDETQTLTFEGTDKGITGPTSAETGKAEITFENNGSKTSDMQLLRVEGKHSPAEVAEALGAAGQGQPFPDWFFAGGGAGTTPSDGGTQVVTEVLEPGTYYAVNTGGPPDPKRLAKMTVTGEESDEELEADSEVDAVDYGFTAKDLKAGENEILFSNTGQQPHHILASKAIGDGTAADAEKFFKSDGQGKPPLREKGTQDTAVVEGGESQLVTLNLEPGKYILYCFISDRQGGPPHALKGMVDEVQVGE
jgi:hypothetical protein